MWSPLRHNIKAIYLPSSLVSLENGEPKYFYRVSEHVFTMKEDPGKNDAFEHIVEKKRAKNK
jgi:hypothetical protein